MSQLPAHIIEEIKRRKEREQEDKRPFLDIPAPPPPEPPEPEEPKKDSGVVIIDLSINSDAGICQVNAG